MNLWVFCAFVTLLVMVNAAPQDGLVPPKGTLSGGIAARLVRVVRAAPEPEPGPKKDLEGSESAYLYPYAYSYWGHYPYVIVG